MAPELEVVWDGLHGWHDPALHVDALGRGQLTPARATKPVVHMHWLLAPSERWSSARDVARRERERLKKRRVRQQHACDRNRLLVARALARVEQDGAL